MHGIVEGIPKQSSVMAIYHSDTENNAIEGEHTHIIFFAHPQNKLRALKNISKHTKDEIGELIKNCQPVKSMKNFMAYLKSHQIKEEFIGGKFDEKYVQMWNSIEQNDLSCALANRESRKRKREISENVVVKRQKIANIVDIIDEYNIQVIITYTHYIFL